MSNHKPQFHALTYLFTGVTNRVIVPLEVADAFDPASTDPQSVTWHPTPALWDTGATNSVITEATAAKLGLKSVRKVTIVHAGGPEERNQYVVNLRLPNKVSVNGVLVTDCHNTAGNFGAIVGMDIITMGDLAISNHKNQTCMTFRLPSIGKHDYVEDFNRQLHNSMNPNDPCYCGAKDDKGNPRKYRNCHGKTGKPKTH